MTKEKEFKNINTTYWKHMKTFTEVSRKVSNLYFVVSDMNIVNVS